MSIFNKYQTFPMLSTAGRNAKLKYQALKEGEQLCFGKRKSLNFAEIQIQELVLQFIITLILQRTRRLQKRKQSWKKSLKTKWGKIMTNNFLILVIVMMKRNSLKRLR